MPSKCRVLLVQLPIPPAGLEPVRGNVPLAAGYLKLMARQRGLESRFDIDIFDPRQANSLSDEGLVAALAAHRPDLVGFTCYVWNIDRSLWVAERLKQLLPEVKIILGGPEITADNAWVLGRPEVDFAAIGEGEQTFAELLTSMDSGTPVSPGAIDGLYVREQSVSGSVGGAGLPVIAMPRFRAPLANLDEVSSPYTAGILDAADEQMLLLETIRGCIFKCKFCYYPKSYDALYFASRERIAANLAHARERGAREVVLLDPTLNQRRDFADFLRLLAAENPQRQFTYFGELRGEGITPGTARLLRDANFEEVEIGLQSVDPLAQQLMDRPNNLRAFERGAEAMLATGIRVKVDLIIGLPGDTAESIRRGIRYFVETGFSRNVQVFQLSVLPGTAFRQEAQQLGLRYAPRPPYYVLETPTLTLPEMVDLMREAQQEFGIEFDALTEPALDFDHGAQPCRVWRVDLDGVDGGSSREGYRAADDPLPPAAVRSQAFTLWLCATDFNSHSARDTAVQLVDRLLADNPHSTLQVILEPVGDPRRLSVTTLEALRRACFARLSYLDRFYSLSPGQPRGAKRFVILLPARLRKQVDDAWQDALVDYATIVWRSPGEEHEAAPQSGRLTIV